MYEIESIFFNHSALLGWSGMVWWVGHVTGMGELRIHTKFLSENVKRGDVLGDINIDFVDENELTFLNCFVMV